MQKPLILSNEWNSDPALPEGFTRKVRFRPGWHDQSGSKRNIGAHHMEIWFVLRGPKGVVTVTLTTPWYPLSVVTHDTPPKRGLP